MNCPSHTQHAVSLGRAYPNARQPLLLLSCLKFRPPVCGDKALTRDAGMTQAPFSGNDYIEPRKALEVIITCRLAPVRFKEQLAYREASRKCARTPCRSHKKVARLQEDYSMEVHALLERQQLWGLKALSGDSLESVNH